MTRPNVRLLILALLLATLPIPLAWASSPVPDAFSPDSFWNTPFEYGTQIHPNSDSIIDFLMADNDLNGCITLAGTSGNAWGMPTFVADTSDPVYDVATRKWDVPPEFASLRIPAGATPADNSDGEMVVYDLSAGLVAQLSKAAYDPGTSKWTVNGGSIAYLNSNGLDGSLAESDEPRNDGTFRGYPGSVAMVHYDDVANGKVDNVVKIGVKSSTAGFLFPMIGSDGSSAHPYAPQQGMRMRIRPDVDLTGLGLSGQALVIARGLQDYGMIIADSTGGAIVLMLEDTIAEGRGDLWNLERESLCAIHGNHLEIVTDAPTSPSGFADVGGHDFEDEITWMVQSGITTGCAPGRFCPDDPVTRGQMAAFLNRALNLAPAASAGFSDTRGHIFEMDIDRLYAGGITAGCGSGRFCPGNLVTRGEMAAFLVRGFELPDAGPSPFTDISGSIFVEEIERLAAAGITRGCRESSFCPDDPVTRGQMAAFLKRAMEG